jgi:hypothetical protein
MPYGSRRHNTRGVSSGGELFPAEALAHSDGTSYLDYFQHLRRTGAAKGIVMIDLETLP